MGIITKRSTKSFFFFNVKRRRKKDVKTERRNPQGINSKIP